MRVLLLLIIFCFIPSCSIHFSMHKIFQDTNSTQLKDYNATLEIKKE